MRRVLGQFLGRPIYSYPVMLYFGIVLGIYIELLAASRVGVDSGDLLLATLVMAAVALLGSRLLYVALYWSNFRGEPARILRFAEGGASIYGGLLLAVPVSLLALQIFGIRFGVFWDLVTFVMLAGMAVGRIGCFLSGCCAGRAYAGCLSMYLPDEQGRWRRRIPSQLVESAWSVILLAGAVALWRRLPFDGALLLYSMAGYGGGRLFLENLRQNPDRVAGVSAQRAISWSLIGIALAIFTLVAWGLLPIGGR
jgi:phosphatidylglycerol---prolipoprotein diacylglyceryl transferase